MNCEYKPNTMSLLLTFTLSIHLSLKVKVIQSCPTLCDPMDYAVHGIPQARILEWVAFPFPREFSQPRDWIGVSYFAGGFFTNWAIREAPSVIILNLFTYLLFLSKCLSKFLSKSVFWVHRVSASMVPSILGPSSTSPLSCLVIFPEALHFFYLSVCWTGPGLCWDKALLLAQPKRTFITPKSMTPESQERDQLL